MSEASSAKASAPSSLLAEVDLTVGRFHLGLTVAVNPGEVVAVLGPNGSGKSTLLRALAGLVPLDEGRIELDGQVLDDPAADVFVPPEERPVGVVFQSYLLFPHLSALDNVAFGLRRRGVPRRVARVRALAWLDRVGLAGKADARPGELSGGQAQRVALARAVVTDPAMLLLDEPLSALDVRTRADVRRDLATYLDGYAGVRVLVTHDPLDALALADRIVILEDGRVTQVGPPGEVPARPRTPYVADLVGTNLYRGRATGAHVELDTGLQVVTSTGSDGPVFVVIPPGAVSVYRTRPDGSPRNVYEATIEHVQPLRNRARATARVGNTTMAADVTLDAVSQLGLHAGDRVWLSVKATEVAAYPA